MGKAKPKLNEWANWHPENWDNLSLYWLKSADGARALALVKAAPELLAACKASEWGGRIATPDTNWAECCPCCKGIKPESRWSHCFIREAIGHKPNCILRAAIARAESESP